MKTFSFIPPDTLENQQKNWETVMNSNKASEFDVFQGGSAASFGFTDLTSYWATYYLFGPIAYCSINLRGTLGLSWVSGAVLLLPFARAKRSATSADYIQGHDKYLFRDQALTEFVFGLGQYTSTVSKLEAVGAYSSILNTSVTLSFWYFRD